MSLFSVSTIFNKNRGHIFRMNQNDQMMSVLQTKGLMLFLAYYNLSGCQIYVWYAALEALKYEGGDHKL